MKHVINSTDKLSRHEAAMAEVNLYIMAGLGLIAAIMS
jgi:hypothetical protein